MPNPYATAGQAEFQAALADHLPTGPAWPQPGPGDADTVLMRLLAGLADGLAALHIRAADLTERESDPAQTAELLERWEAAYGLPDPCTPLGSTLQARRSALLAKIAAQGAATPAYFEAVCAALGITGTVTELGNHAWQVALPATQLIYFRAGASEAGDHLGEFVTGQAECVLTRLKPAHTVLTFSYPP